jgi:hypothetical protein
MPRSPVMHPGDVNDPDRTTRPKLAIRPFGHYFLQAHGTRTPRRAASTMAFCTVPSDRIPFTSSSTVGSAEAARLRTPTVTAIPTSLKSDCVPADGTKAANWSKRRLRYVAVFWAALGQTTA